MKPRVVFFVESMDMMGGVERVIEFLAHELSGDYNITILTMVGEVCEDFKISSTVESLNIKISPINYVNKFKRYVETINKLNKFIKSNSDIDYFIANSAALSCSSAIVNIFTKNKIKFIAFEHNKFSLPSRFWQCIRKYTFSRLYRVIALTQDAHKEYLRIDCPSVHIPNAITIKIEDSSSLVNKKLVAIGRLTHQKGFDSLLKAWAIVCYKYPDWVLEIVGEGQDEIILKQLASDLNITKNVIFYGKSTHVQERYRDATGFILSSRYEGFCLVMIEAMAHGLPCISFNCESGPNEVIKDGINGFLVKDQNIDEMAAKIELYISLSNEQKLLMSEQAKLVAQDYLPQNIIRQWKEDVFKN